METLKVRYLALCCDYDGTLAEEGRVSAASVAALIRLRATGRKLLLVTGRILSELQGIFDRLDLFDRVVAENGAVLYNPATGAERLLSTRPLDLFIQTLRERGVNPLSIGQVVVAAWLPHDTILLETIRDLGLELQVIFNKDAVMVLPAGVNKASGLACALQELNISAHNIVGIGDAENDHAFLAACEVGVATENALPLLKSAADFVTKNARGSGVQELIAQILEDDLRSREARLARHRLLLGKEESGEDILVHAPDFNGCIAGANAADNAACATGLLARLASQRYNHCIVDPRGDFATLEGAISVGTAERAPTLEETRQLLNTFDTNVVVNIEAMKSEDRPAFFQALLSQIKKSRACSGRPHWLVVNEAELVLPCEQNDAAAAPLDLKGVLFISSAPAKIAVSALGGMTSALAIGSDAARVLAELAVAAGRTAPGYATPELHSDEALYWPVTQSLPPRKITVPAGKLDERRPTRKHEERKLSEERSFYFRGPENKLNLRAQNLSAFLQLAEGVDDATWLYHLQEGDYSRWARKALEDNELADEIANVEGETGTSAPASRGIIRELIEARYALPAE